jgi:hypothetical protein
MFNKLAISLCFLLFNVCGISNQLHAESEMEGRFQDAFVTAGYSAAAGAAIGAALLTFQESPMEHLKYISMGASIGFLTGTALGGWIAIAPVFVENGKPTSDHLAGRGKMGQVIFRPWIETNKNSLRGFEAGTTIASF